MWQLLGGHSNVKKGKIWTVFVSRGTALEEALVTYVSAWDKRFMERAMGIEIIATWFFKDLRSRARTDLEGLGTLRNPYCRLNAALLP
jgi:hypothetical protein